MPWRHLQHDRQETIFGGRKPAVAYVRPVCVLTVIGGRLVVDGPDLRVTSPPPSPGGQTVIPRGRSMFYGQQSP